MLWILLLLSCSTIAQPSFVKTHYTDERGLPQNNVKSVVQDEFGFIWVCTENGLAYFDGARFTTFNAGDLGLSSNRFSYIARSGKQLFARNSNDEYVEIKNLTARRIDSPPAPVHPNNLQAFSIMQYANDTHPYRIVYSKYTWEIADNQLLQISQSDTLVIALPAKIAPKAMVLLNDHLYLGFDAFYAVWNGKHLKTHNHLSDFQWKHHQFIWNRAENQLFFTDNQHIFILNQMDDGSLTSTCVGDHSGDIAPYVRSMFYDGYTLYIASSHKGLILQRPSVFKTIFNDLNQRDVYYGMGKLNDSTLLTSSGKIIASNGKTDTSMFKLWSTALEMGLHGNHYRTLGKKLIEIDKMGASSVVKSFPGELLTLYSDTLNNILWVGTDSGGSDPQKLYGIDLMTFELRKTMNIGHSMRTVYPLTDSTLLVGTFSGLLQLNIHSNTHKKIGDGNLGEVRHIMPLLNDVLIIYTYGKGLFLLKDGSLSRIPLDERQFLRFSHYGFFDRNNLLWVVTNRGLFQFDPKMLQRVVANPNAPLVYRYFDKTDGLYVNEFNGGCNRCAIETKTGKWTLPSMDGLTMFSPDSIPFIPHNDKLIVTEANADGRLFSSGDKIPHNTSVIEISVASHRAPFHYSSGIDVRLSGSDRWVPLPENAPIRFVGLPYDNYELQIRKPIDLHGTMNSIVFTFSIPPPFWKTRTFYTTIIVFVVLIISLFIYLRVRFLQRQNESLERVVQEQTKHLRALVKDLRLLVRQEKELSEENERVVSILAHDVRSPLRFLSMMFRELVQGRTQLMNSDLEVAKETTEHLYKYVEDILKTGHHPKGKKIKTRDHVALAKLVSQKTSLFSGLAEQNGIDITRDIPESTVVYTNKNILSIVLHNLIDNAVKHNRKETLHIRWDNETQALVIYNSGGSVSDDVVREWNRCFEGGQNNKEIMNGKTRGMAMIIELSQIANIFIVVRKPKRGGLEFRLELA